MTQLDKEEIEVVKIALSFLLETSYGATEAHFKARDELCDRLDVKALPHPTPQGKEN